MHHPTDRITHTTAFVTPVVEHWLEREIAQRVHPMKDRSDDPPHHERNMYKDASTTQGNFILPAPPVGVLPIYQDRLDRMKLYATILPSGKDIMANSMFKFRVGTNILSLSFKCCNNVFVPTSLLQHLICNKVKVPL